MSIIDQYAYLTKHIVPGPQSISYFVPTILLPISLLIPRSKLSRWQNISIFMPLITLCSLRAWQIMDGVDVISVNTFLWSLFLIALEDPWRDFRLVAGSPAVDVRDRGVKRDISSAGLEQTYPPALADRLVWVGKLLPSIRLDWWKISRASHDKQQPPSAGFDNATRFLLHSVLSLFRGLLILDTTRAYIQYDVYFTDPYQSIAAPLPFNAPKMLAPQLFRSIIAGAQAYALIGEMFYLPAAIPALLYMAGLLPERYSPHSWPAYFGSPSVIFNFGVRGFWGQFWHQTMRWTAAGPGYAVSDALDLHPGSIFRYAIISLSAFGLSGVVHAGLVPPEPRYMRESVSSVRLSMAGFFWSQWLAVVLEALAGRAMTSVFGPWKKGHRKGIRMIVNCLWTILWFSLSLPLLMDAARQLGYWRPWPLPVSPIKWLNGESAYTWT